MSTAEEVTLLIALRDRASAGVDALRNRVTNLGPAGRVAAQGLEMAGRAASALGARAVAGVDALIGRVMRLARWAELAAVAFAGIQVRSAIRINAEIERFTMSLNVLYNSAARAKDALAFVQEFAWKTPFSLEEAMASAKQLVGIGADMKKWMEPLSDIAAALNVPLEQTLTGFRYLFSGAGGMARRSFRYMGLDIAQAGIKFDAHGEMAEPMEEVLEKFYGWARTRFGGMSAELAKTFVGVTSNIAIRWKLFLKEMTAPTFTALTRDLAKLYAWMGKPGEGELGKLAARVQAPMQALYMRASRGVAQFFSRGLSEGFGTAFAALWKSLEPAITKAAGWVAGTFARAFWTALKGLMKEGASGNPYALMGLAYIGAKLGGGAAVAAGARSIWGRVGGAAGTAGASAVGVAGGMTAAQLLAARLAMGGAAAAPPVEYLLGMKAAAAGGAGAAGGGWLAAVGGVGTIAVVAAAVLATAAVGTAIASQIKTGKWWTYFEDMGGGSGAGERWAKGAKLPWWSYLIPGMAPLTFAYNRLSGRGAREAGFEAGESAERKGMSAAEKRRLAREQEQYDRDAMRGILRNFLGRQAELERLLGRMDDVQSGLAESMRSANFEAMIERATPTERIAARMGEISRLQEKLAGLDAELAPDFLRASYARQIARFQGRIAVLDVLRADVRRAFPMTETPGFQDKGAARDVRAAETQTTSHVSEIAKLQEKIAALDAQRAKAAEGALEIYEKQTAVLAKQFELYMKIADEMDAIREKAFSRAEKLLTMGPQDRTRFLREEDYIKNLDAEGLERFFSWERGREIAGKHDLRDLIAQPKWEAWMRLAGQPALPESGDEARKKAEAAIGQESARRIQAAREVVSIETARIEVQIGRVEYILSRQNSEGLIDAIRLAIQEGDEQLVAEIKAALGDRFNEISRAAQE